MTAYGINMTSGDPVVGWNEIGRGRQVSEAERRIQAAHPIWNLRDRVIDYRIDLGESEGLDTTDAVMMHLTGAIEKLAGAARMIEQGSSMDGRGCLLEGWKILDAVSRSRPLDRKAAELMVDASSLYGNYSRIDQRSITR